MDIWWSQMNDNGQIFSIDLIFATILIIVFIGILINITEVNNYEKRESIIQNEFYLKGQTALNLLTHSDFSCDFEEIKLGNSLNKNKLELTSNDQLIEKLGLIDTNFEIYLGNDIIKQFGEMNGKNILVYSLEVLTCDDNSNPLDINSITPCLNNQLTLCELQKENLIMRMSK